jgi:hypothetical protein
VSDCTPYRLGYRVAWDTVSQRCEFGFLKGSHGAEARHDPSPHAQAARAQSAASLQEPRGSARRGGARCGHSVPRPRADAFTWYTCSLRVIVEKRTVWAGKRRHGRGGLTDSLACSRRRRLSPFGCGWSGRQPATVAYCMQLLTTLRRTAGCTVPTPVLFSQRSRGQNCTR